jgi:hypothetical protein
MGIGFDKAPKSTQNLVIFNQQSTMSKIIPHLVNMEPMSSADPRIFLIDDHVALTKEYLKNQDDRVKLERDFDTGMDFAEWCKLSVSFHKEHDELSYKMIKEGIFKSKHDYRSFWKFVGKDEDDITLADLQKQLEEN